MSGLQISYEDKTGTSYAECFVRPVVNNYECGACCDFELRFYKDKAAFDGGKHWFKNFRFGINKGQQNWEKLKRTETKKADKDLVECILDVVVTWDGTTSEDGDSQGIPGIDFTKAKRITDSE